MNSALVTKLAQYAKPGAGGGCGTGGKARIATAGPGIITNPGTAARCGPWGGGGAWCGSCGNAWGPCGGHVQTKFLCSGDKSSSLILSFILGFLKVWQVIVDYEKISLLFQLD